MRKLNSAERLWLVFAIAMLASSLGAIYMGWPDRDSAIVADLLAPECEIWRTDPQSLIENRYHPASESECRALRTFYERHHDVVLQSESDYDHFRLRDGLNRAMVFLGGWAIAMVALYLFGWTAGLLVRALPKWPRKAR